MILAVDMGNSNIVVGGLDDQATYFEERITTDDRKTSLEYAIMLKNILEIHKIKRSDIEGSIISSVVPPLNAPLSSAVKKITGKRPFLVGSGMKTGLNIKMDNPKAVGRRPDRWLRWLPLQDMRAPSSSSTWGPPPPWMWWTRQAPTSAA